MIVKDCDEEVSVPRSEEKAERELTELNKTLKNAFSSYEKDEARLSDPKQWVDDVAAAIRRTNCLLKLRRKYPKLEDLYSLVETSLQHARRRLPGYSKLWNVKIPTDLD